MCVYLCVCLFKYLDVRVPMRVCVREFVFVCVIVSLNVHACVCVCV